jgi:hypothetical protein
MSPWYVFAFVWMLFTKTVLSLSLVLVVIDNQIYVTQYISKQSQMSEAEQKENIESDRTMFQYRYEMWLPQMQRFQTMTQTFYQFPVPEFLWNKVDNIMMGDICYDGVEEGKKPRSLKYLVIPNDITCERDLDEYYAKIDLLIEFLNKYAVSKDSDDAMHIVKDRTLLPEQQAGHFLVPTIHSKSVHQVYRQCSKQFNIFKCNMRGPRHENPNWLYIKYDAVIYPFRAFHIFLHWFVCDSWLVDEFCNVLFRRCTKWGLRLSHIPGYFAQQNLNIHPFRPLLCIQVPPMSVSVPVVHCTPVRLIERIFFSRENGWIFDSERATEWTKIGLPTPNYLDRDRDLLLTDDAEAVTAALVAAQGPNNNTNNNNNNNNPSLLSSKLLTASLSSITKSFQRIAQPVQRSNTLTHDDSHLDNPSPLSFLHKANNHRQDRQYTFNLGLATVRMGASGFLWLPCASAKVSDVTIPPEERSEIACRKQAELQSFVVAAVDCYEILLDVLDRVLDLVEKDELVTAAAAVAMGVSEHGALSPIRT